MTDFFQQQTEWVKSWQQNQEKLMKQYADWGQSMMSGATGALNKESEVFKGWAEGDLTAPFMEFCRRMNEGIGEAWGGKLSPEMRKFMDISFFGEFHKSCVSTFGLPEGVCQKATEFLESLTKTRRPFSSFGPNAFMEGMNWVLGVLQGTVGQEENYLSEVVKGYQDAFTKIFESTTSQSMEKLTEVFDAWSKEIEKNLSAPKLGINRELANDFSQLLLLSQRYLQAHQRYARVIEATARKAGVNFQTKLSEATLNNKPVHKFVDLCALWSVENEKVFSEVMGSEEYTRLQGDLVDAGHRLKIHMNRLGERALEQTPLALKRDLDLAIAEITQLKREMRTMRNVLREMEKNTDALRGAYMQGMKGDGKGAARAPSDKERKEKGATVVRVATGKGKGGGAAAKETAKRRAEEETAGSAGKRAAKSRKIV